MSWLWFRMHVWNKYSTPEPKIYFLTLKPSDYKLQPTVQVTLSPTRLCRKPIQARNPMGPDSPSMRHASDPMRVLVRSRCLSVLFFISIWPIRT
jgi:hypothetical protein